MEFGHSVQEQQMICRILDCFRLAMVADGRSSNCYYRKRCVCYKVAMFESECELIGVAIDDLAQLIYCADGSRFLALLDRPVRVCVRPIRTVFGLRG